MASEIWPGTFHVKRYLSVAEQQSLVARCHELGSRPAGFYKPTLRSGSEMRLRMMCLGRHWNPQTYTYGPTRDDSDRLPVQALPDELAALARRVAAEVGMTIVPDVCIVNFYIAGGKPGLHQDKSERDATLATGVPIVSLSLGDSAAFQVGGMSRTDPVKTLLVESGDAVVMGGPSRLRFHGVTKVYPATNELGIGGRFNLTFRQS
jgi:DNA alkylation damage repair protein AlkB